MQLVMRDTLDEDLPALYRQQADPEAVHMAAFVPPRDLGIFEMFWRRNRENPDNILKTVLLDGEIVATALSFIMEGERNIGYWVDRAYWGKGIATEATRMLVAEIETRPLFARAVIDNVGSLRVLEKCGFVKIGEEIAHADGRNEDVTEIIMRLDA